MSAICAAYFVLTRRRVSSVTSMPPIAKRAVALIEREASTASSRTPELLAAGLLRCARSTRSRPAANNSGVRDEAVDASRSINATARFAMGGMDVTEETRRRVRTKYAAQMADIANDETSYARSQTPGE